MRCYMDTGPTIADRIRERTSQLLSLSTGTSYVVVLVRVKIKATACYFQLPQYLEIKLK